MSEGVPKPPCFGLFNTPPLPRGVCGAFIILFLIFIVSACAPVHRIVKVKTVQDEKGVSKSTYGVTYNNMLIPEYTKTAAGTYASSHEEAAGMLRKRGKEVDSWAGNKYRVSNPLFFRFADGISRAGLAVGAPFAIPVQWTGERLFPDPELGKRHSLKETFNEYFEYQYDEPSEKLMGAQEPSFGPL